MTTYLSKSDSLLGLNLSKIRNLLKKQPLTSKSQDLYRRIKMCQLLNRAFLITGDGYIWRHECQTLADQDLFPLRYALPHTNPTASADDLFTTFCCRALLHVSGIPLFSVWHTPREPWTWIRWTCDDAGSSAMTSHDHNIVNITIN